MAKQPLPAKKPLFSKNQIYLYAMIAIPLALMFIPTVIMLAFIFLPACVAMLIERSRGWYCGVCVGAMSLAGASPAMTDLWFNNHSIQGAFQTIGNLWTILLIYGCAAIGWAIYSPTPSIVSTFMAMTAGRRIEALKLQQKELVLKWGTDVESVYEPQDKGAGQTMGQAEMG
jgi:hypothetical protein